MAPPQTHASRPLARFGGPHALDPVQKGGDDAIGLPEWDLVVDHDYDRGEVRGMEWCL
jgi:hypothetical protein